MLARMLLPSGRRGEARPAAPGDHDKGFSKPNSIALI
jgi:hypothetical protein